MEKISPERIWLKKTLLSLLSLPKRLLILEMVVE
jgi:hypothetical protein